MSESRETMAASVWRAEHASCADEFPLMVLVLYERPIDFPMHWVLRPQYAGRGGTIRPSTLSMTFDTAPEAQAFVARWRPDLTPMLPMPGDEPHIRMTWI